MTDSSPSTQLAEIRERDRTSAATWYEGPASPKSQCFRDRRALLQSVADLQRQLKGANASAERWRALIGCARITAMGSAGLVVPRDDGYAHLTVNLWTQGERETETYPREWLTQFVDIARAAVTKSATMTELNAKFAGRERGDDWGELTPRMSGETSVSRLPFVVVADPDMPPDQIEFRGSTGQRVRIVNLKMPDNECPVCRRMIDDDEVLGSCMHTKDGKHRRVVASHTSERARILDAAAATCNVDNYMATVQAMVDEQQK